jgi:hypothetical protein
VRFGETALLERLCGHALKFGCESFGVVYEEGFQRAWAQIDGAPTRIANFKRTGRDARELSENFSAAIKKPVQTVLNGRRCVLRVRSFENAAFEVTIEPAPALDPSVPPRFTAKQGQYLAYLYHYNKIHKQAPSEADLQRYFRVSPPAVHDMIKLLERSGLIERTPGVGRSIRVLVRPEHLPSLE